MKVNRKFSKKWLFIKTIVPQLGLNEFIFRETTRILTNEKRKNIRFIGS
jgi:hypothetical protein